MTVALVKVNLTGLACDCPGSSGTAKTAECSSVLPTAHAAAANQQCPTPQPGCCATGNNGILQKQGLQKKKVSLFHHQCLRFSPSKATLAAGRQSTTASNSMPQAATTVGVCCGFYKNVELSLIMVLLKQTGLPPLHRSI